MSIARIPRLFNTRQSVLRRLAERDAIVAEEREAKLAAIHLIQGAVEELTQMAVGLDHWLLDTHPGADLGLARGHAEAERQQARTDLEAKAVDPVDPELDEEPFGI